ncbi:MAG: hypothetical protein B6D64_10955 [Bacteroidetes bacterium 4484_276]|nr:MAG: hypothetical protein B6D64_10955 [Bacteroidetes bacterium 4484_276]OYT13738.1 MAG: hypothetical protein B6I19_03545 [Bacteroidetes bacterium 4572_114]
MQNQLTNISCITSLAIIFISAAILQTQFYWIIGVAGILVIFAIRNWHGEVSRKTELFMTLLSWLFTIITIGTLI